MQPPSPEFFYLLLVLLLICLFCLLVFPTVAVEENGRAMHVGVSPFYSMRAAKVRPVSLCQKVPAEAAGTFSVFPPAKRGCFLAHSRPDQIIAEEVALRHLKKAASIGDARLFIDPLDRFKGGAHAPDREDIV